ncbi:MAG TPA: Nramp family divalent metal transporter [Longimicrobiales bacterium]|nr:Nramp family divalent metal transporter [Longimicrobiales bacterium]
MLEVRASVEEGRRYRNGVYRPIDEAALPEAPDDPDRFPERGAGPPFRRVDEVPRVPRLAHVIGPSMIALGMGLGAGELLLWPNLIAVNGYQIWWLFWVGVMTQFVVIGEIERWTIATGESVFAGMARLDRLSFWPWFFLIATLASFLWPGWASQSADFAVTIVEAASGVRFRWQPIAIVMLVFIWVGLAVSKIVYNALERFEIALVVGFFPLLGLALFVAGIVPADLLALVEGAASVGRAPRALLTGDQFPTLLLAVAYAGSGGTLLLAQSLWLRDKGFGMGVYQGRIAGIRGTDEDVSATGFAFDARAALPLARFRAWIRVAHRELLITFVALILVSVVITSLLVTSTLGTGRSDLAGQLATTVSAQGEVLRLSGGVWLEVVFLLGGAFVLFSTQLGIIDTVTRITGSIFYERYGRYTSFWTLKRSFLFFLTVLTLGSIAIIVASWVGGEGLDVLQPDFLVLVAGPFTITSMYAFAIVVGYMNFRRLPGALAPPLWRRVGMVWAAALWGWFTAEQLSRTVLGASGAPAAVIESIAYHPARAGFYGLWLLSLVWFGWAILARGRELAQVPSSQE